MSVPKRPSMTPESLIAQTQSRSVAASPDTVWACIVTAPLADIIPGGGGLPGVRGTDALPGPAWGLDGARRKVLLTDGGTAYEAIVQAAPDRVSKLFRYQVWGASGLGGLLIDHAQGRFVLDAEGAGTTLSWTYAFKPRAAILAPIVKRLAERRFAAFMAAALDAIAARAEGAPR